MQHSSGLFQPVLTEAIYLDARPKMPLPRLPPGIEPGSVITVMFHPSYHWTTVVIPRERTFCGDHLSIPPSSTSPPRIGLWLL